MNITFISDTHGKHRQLDSFLKGGDVLVHCGDISSMGGFGEVDNFLRWFDRLDQYDHKIFIAGNHDFFFQSHEVIMNDVLEDVFDIYSNVIYLADSEVEIDGIKFYGSPWTPEFNNWAFNATDKELEDIWTDIPLDTDVLITHGPPKGILDVTEEGISAGDEALAQALSRVRPSVHAFGHIHEAYGMDKFSGKTPIRFINASSANRKYQIVNEPIIINI